MQDVTTSQLAFDKHVVVVWGYSPVLASIVLLWVVFLVVGEESVELVALLKVVDSLKTADVLHEIKISKSVDACTHKSVPVNTLQFDVRVVLLEREVQSFSEIYVRALDAVHVFICHFEL